MRPVIDARSLRHPPGTEQHGPRGFAPLIVSLENPGANLDVEVRVDVAWGAGVRSAPYHRIFARTALLPSGATRRIPFMVPVRRDERALRVSVM